MAAEKIVLQSGDESNILALTKLLMKEENTTPLYISGMVIDPSQPKHIRQAAKDMFSALCYIELNYNGATSLIAGETIKFRMNKDITQWGFRPFKVNGDKVPSILKPPLNIGLNIIYANRPSEHGQKMYYKYKKFFTPPL